jgi:hypothetical protein
MAGDYLQTGPVGEVPLRSIPKTGLPTTLLPSPSCMYGIKLAGNV